MRNIALLFSLTCASAALGQESRPPFHLWLEPEWFEGVNGTFAYWTGGPGKATGSWGVAGPGISAEWNQGGESEWNSMGAPAEETKAACQRAITIPRAGKYKVWVRYVDHRKKTEPFRVSIEQGGKKPLTGELGLQPVVPPNDEFQLFYGFSFGWGAVEGTLEAGPAKLVLAIERAAEAWRQVDAVLITDDLKFEPHGREKPAFTYYDSYKLQPKGGAKWRGDAKGLTVGADWKRKPLAGRDFAMWTGIDPDPKWWAKQDVSKLTLYDIFFEFSPPTDIKTQFHKQFAGRKDVPVMSWPGLLPGLYLGNTPDLSPGTPLRNWLERTKTPFYIMTNYASGSYNDKNGPATYTALTGPLAEQFLGYIHGEAIGTGGVGMPDKALAPDRRGHADAMFKQFKTQQADQWSKIYKTKVPEDHWNKGISCLSVDSISLAHLFHESGSKVVGYELDSTNAHVPMRIAFERGAARQYGNNWINYASGNFGDACNYFTQQHMNRGAGAWFHSRYAITDGVSAAWYRKLYYLNYLGGASAIYWEQSLVNQYILPGPGTHPVQLSPFGRGTEEFQAFVSRLPDRGEPYTPVAFLLSHGHGYERVNYRCKMLHTFQENDNDLELRELFNVAWHPIVPLEGQPAAPDVQSTPSGVYGDIFDVLVDRPAKAKAMFNYPIVWAAGDVNLKGEMGKAVADYVKAGGTFVTCVTSAKDLPVQLMGVRWTSKNKRLETWRPDDEDVERAVVPYDVAEADLIGAKVLAWGADKSPLVTRHAVGAGAIIVIHVAHLMGVDERAHPVLPWLMNGLTQTLLPVDVRLANGQRPGGEIMYQVNKTKDGWLVTLINNRGIDKTQNGLARVDRRMFADIVIHPRFAVTSAKEWTGPRDLAVRKGDQGPEIAIRVHPGDVQVVGIVAGK